MVKPFYLFSCIQVPFILLQIINFVLAIKEYHNGSITENQK